MKVRLAAGEERERCVRKDKTEETGRGKMERKSGGGERRKKWRSGRVYSIRIDLCREVVVETGHLHVSRV